MSVAERMSWASKRNTTRTEDIAYCLMGIFDVHMPLVYGEGKGAFLRLQEEIMKDSDDQSLFAWTAQDDTELVTGLLAESPANFVSSKDISSFQTTKMKAPYSTTNRGLRIELPLKMDGQVGIYLAFLGCRSDKDSKTVYAIHLQAVSLDGNQFVRVNSTKLWKLSLQSLQSASAKEVFVKRMNVNLEKYELENAIRIRRLPPLFQLSEVSPFDRWNPSLGLFRTYQMGDILVGLLLTGQARSVAVILGNTQENTPWCNVLHAEPGEKIQKILSRSHSKFPNGMRKVLNGGGTLVVQIHTEVASSGVVLKNVDITIEW